MRHKVAIAMFLVAGCAGSDELSLRAQQHMSAANQAAARGDQRGTIHEQRRAEVLYQRADARAFEEERPAPTPPGPAPLPLFDPQLIH
jgi:hypothetical protein